jgi:myo-inositol-1(or 4)-monophosphatase
VSTPISLSARCEAARRAVLAQTELMHRELGRARTSWKPDGTRVTTADVSISENIFRELSAVFPEDQFFSEELSHDGAPLPVTARYAWVLDPIDGTNNYAFGIPHCAISLALLEQGRPVFGAVYDLAGRQLIHGGAGQGVYCGDRPVALRGGNLTAQSMIGFHSPYDKRYAPHAGLLAGNYKIRGLGSSTLHLAYVAAGLIDAVVDHNVKVWDIAAAVPLLEAAGGEICFLTAAPFPLQVFDLKMSRIFYVAGSPAACRQLRELLGV